MSPDWSAKAEPVPYAKLDDPQTLNLYAYMRNNPLGGVDADGHAPEWWQKLVNSVYLRGWQTDNQAAPLPPPPPTPDPPRTRFMTKKEAGVAAEQKINPTSAKNGQEHGGLLMKNTDGTYSYAKPVAGDCCRVGIPFGTTLPADATRAGDYHTHGDGKDSSDKGEDFSGGKGRTPGDREMSQAHMRYYHGDQPSFLGTPSGAIKMYDPATGKTTTLPDRTN
jgi:hypothetical protein